jgi:hypothetical protein
LDVSFLQTKRCLHCGSDPAADGGVFDHSPYRDQAIANAKQKQVDLQFHQIFLRAIGCNWLVCLACYLGLQAKDLTSKVVGMWWPIFAFVTLGLEHVVANMFFIPMGLFLGTPGLTIPLYIWKGMHTPQRRGWPYDLVIAHSVLTGIIPATIGNILGGAGFCGAFYYWLHIFDEPDICVDGTYYQRLEEGTLFGSTVVVDTASAKGGSSTENVREDENSTKVH